MIKESFYKDKFKFISDIYIKKCKFLTYTKKLK